MKKALDFIIFALTHAKYESIPEGAELPVDREECGREPWEYIYGLSGQQVTFNLLDERFDNFYSKRGWTREAFDIAARNFAIGRRRAADSPGLLTAFLGDEVSANYCYNAWCTEKGALCDVERPYELGEALFYRNGDGVMTHVGFVCGFLNGEPLTVEARGIRFGVVVTRLSERPWTHRGKVTEKLSYDTEYSLSQTTLTVDPEVRRECILELQRALNSLGYYCGVPDGRCGRLTMGGVREFAKKHAAV